MAVALILNGGTVYGQATTTASAAKAGHDLGEIGAKLSNPASDVWALFTEFDLFLSDGDLNLGDAQVGGRMILQPVLPFPLYGEGKHEWRLATRPTMPHPVVGLRKHGAPGDPGTKRFFGPAKWRFVVVRRGFCNSHHRRNQSWPMKIFASGIDV